MFDSNHDLLIRGIAAAKAGEKAEARHYLEWLIDIGNAPQDEMIEAWWYLCTISDDPKEKRDLLENILAHSPTEARARRQLAILDGKIKTGELVDPDKLQKTIPIEPIKAGADRFTCPKCGGRMTFAPDGQTLTCEYCEARQSLRSKNSVTDQDFRVALATAKGHLRPVSYTTFTCQGCGAGFVLPPDHLTQICPYCGSAYVVQNPDAKELLEPTAVIPFAVDELQAKQALATWLQAKPIKEQVRVAPGLGIYLPIWVFTLTGQIPWRCLRKHEKQWVPDNGLEIVFQDDVMVEATDHIPELWSKEMHAYDLHQSVPYDPRYLADWGAETYSISVTDASLRARQQALATERQQIESGFLSEYKDLTLSSTEMVVESYRLVLLPAWLITYMVGQERYHVIINGQTGKVRGERPGSGIGKWIGKMLGEQ